jgi:FixJ family two-component response regulator
MEAVLKEGRIKSTKLTGPVDDHHVRIAVVEDDLMYRQAIETYLRKVPDSEVHSFESGEQCFRHYAEVKPDILVLDYRLNEMTGSNMDGLEVLRKAKSLQPATKVIFLAGQGNMDVAVAAIKGGAVDFITKDKNGLTRLVNTVQRMTLSIQLKRQETKTSRWITVGLIAIALIVLGTVAADSEGMRDVWNWLWFMLCAGSVVLLVRSWVKRSKTEMKKIHSLEFRRSGRWID